MHRGQEPPTKSNRHSRAQGEGVAQGKGTRRSEVERARIFIFGMHSTFMNIFHMMSILKINVLLHTSVADPAVQGGHVPPGPVKISHRKDGPHNRPHRFHVSWLPTRLLDPLLYISALLVTIIL